VTSAYLEADPRSLADARRENGPGRLGQILLIDDDADVRAMLAEMLRRAGYRVIAAPEGEAGMGLLMVWPFDLVITDIEMPRCDGLEFLRWLRSEGPRHLPAIAVSGNGPGGGALYTKASDVAGADLSLAKPVAKRELLAAVGRLIADGRPRADAARDA
jgi:CheY-like chemotaxis protein